LRRQKEKIAKEKGVFLNCSAQKKRLYAVMQFANQLHGAGFLPIPFANHLPFLFHLFGVILLRYKSLRHKKAPSNTQIYLFNQQTMFKNLV